jgi:hypothetical protein
MTKAQLELLLELLGSFVAESQTWHEKKAALLDIASEEDKTNIEEFVTWFDDGIDEPDKDTTEDTE